MWTGPAVIAPLWQGSSIMSAAQAAVGTRRAALALLGPDGLAEAVRLDAPDLPRGREAVEAMRTAVAAAVDELGTEPVLLVGGDCSADLGLLDRSLGEDDVTVLWVDAHADASTPATSPSGAPHGMAARDALDGMPQRLVYAGVRVTDEEEARWIHDEAIPVWSPDAPFSAVLDSVPEGHRLHLHVDLDVLDPSEFSGVGFPEPDGMTVHRLVELVRAVAGSGRLAAAAFCEHVPGPTRRADQGVLERLALALSYPG